MIERKMLMSLGYLKKQNLTGSYKGMRFLLQKQGEDPALLKVFIWPQPLGFDAAPAEQKTEKEFSFSDAGIEEALQWLNERYEAEKDLWENAKL
ncbi:hypothetical protein [Hominifimenecus sp. rT4P-3]|uniref:hypothetical protein n=1 Tax=Hominifimenecus sp. rT4P-3 TaxID=3242979 RepID=UPI003DA505B4